MCVQKNNTVPNGWLIDAVCGGHSTLHSKTCEDTCTRMHQTERHRKSLSHGRIIGQFTEDRGSCLTRVDIWQHSLTHLVEPENLFTYSMGGQVYIAADQNCPDQACLGTRLYEINSVISSFPCPLLCIQQVRKKGKLDYMQQKIATSQTKRWTVWLHSVEEKQGRGIIHGYLARDGRCWHRW